MPPFMRRTGMIGAALCLAWMLFLLVSSRTAIGFTEVLLQPWFNLCSSGTPQTWQTQGNILLGLTWLFSGVAMYSAIAGYVAAGIWAGFTAACLQRRLNEQSPL